MLIGVVSSQSRPIYDLVSLPNRNNTEITGSKSILPYISILSKTIEGFSPHKNGKNYMSSK